MWFWPTKRRKKQYAVTRVRADSSANFYLAREEARLADGSVLVSTEGSSMSFRLFPDGTGQGEYGPVTWAEVVYGE